MPVGGVWPNWDGEEQLQEEQLSTPVNPQQGEALQPRYRVHPGGEVPKEGVEASYDMEIRGGRYTALPGEFKPSQQIPENIARELAGPKHLPHQLRFGVVNGNHGGWA